MHGNTFVWEALAAARRANLRAEGEPPPIAGHEGISRRALLTGLGAAGATALLPREAHAANPGRVAIIGGGLAGLSALHHLVNAGVDARLYEARNRIGGRVHTVEVDGVTFERGGQLVNTDHADIRGLAREFGVALIDRKAGNHRVMVVADGREVAADELATGLRAIAAQIDRDAKALDRDYAGVAPRLDALSMAQYLDRHAALIPQPWVRHLLEATARTEYGAEPAQVSALGLIFNLPVVDGQRVEVLGDSDERFVMAGGSGSLTHALAERYRDRIALGRRTIRIAPGQGVRQGAGRGRLALTFLDRTTEAADHVIVAVPGSLTDTIEYAVPLPARLRQFIKVMELGRCEKLQWAMRDAPWRDTMGTGGEGWSADAAAPASLVWEGTVQGLAKDGPPVWNWFFGGAQVFEPNAAPPPPQALARTFAPIAADLDQHRVAGFTMNATAWHRDPLALGAYSNFPPGQLSRFAPLFWVDGERPPAAGRLMFVGEHLSDAFPGYMNGAAQTGRLAAQAIVGARMPVRQVG